MSNTGRASSKWDDVRAELMGKPEASVAFDAAYPFADVADAVLELRVSRDLTQTDLAICAGTTQSVIARLESGRHPVEVKLLTRIATSLGMRWRPVFEAGASATPEAVPVPANVVPLFGTSVQSRIPKLRGQSVRASGSRPGEVLDALDDLQARIEQVKGMFGATGAANASFVPKPTADAG